MSSRVIAVAGVAMCLHLPALVADARAQSDPQDLKAMSIEQLMQIDVTLATREPEPVGRTAAAITVITGDDIRRAGAYIRRILPAWYAAIERRRPWPTRPLSP